MSVGIIDRIIRNGVDKELDHDSDHFPITTILDLRVTQLDRKPVRNWKHLEEEKYRKALAPSLPKLQRPQTKRALDNYVKAIVESLQNAADEVLPHKTLSPKSREGWSVECSRVLAEAKRLRRKHGRRHTEASWAQVSTIAALMPSSLSDGVFSYISATHPTNLSLTQSSSRLLRNFSKAAAFKSYRKNSSAKK